MKKTAFFILSFTSLFAIQEGSYIQFQEAQSKAEGQDAIEESYENPFLDSIKAPTEVKELTLQQKITNYFGTFVTSSPYPGVRATFEGNELMASLSNVNKDLQILLELSESTKYIEERGLPYPINPRIFMSGEIEFTGFVGKAATGRVSSDVDLTDAEIDFLIVAAPWLYGFINLSYEESADSSMSFSRIENSRIYSNSLFITFGDFTKHPWYGTIGQVYIPYGQYSTYAAVYNPLTKTLFRTLSREVALGFFNDTFQFAAYVFKGDSHADSGNNINNYGVNLGTNFTYNSFDGKIAVGAIRNIADSAGMQALFADTQRYEKLRHVVPGLNVNGNFTLGNWNLLFEYNQALRPFNPNDVSYSADGKTFKGARPAAFDVELAYAFKIAKKPSSIALGYSRSFEALSFNVPKERINLTWATYIFRGNLVSVEGSTNKLYGKNARVGGKTLGSLYYIDPSNLGKRDYSLAIDYLLYF